MSSLETGTTLAGYRIESVLGHGSMGTVYSAETSRSTDASPSRS